MTVVGFDLSTNAIDVVELNERDSRADHFRYDLGKGDVVDRVRRVCYLLPHRDRWEQAIAIGVERPAGEHGAWQVSMSFGAVLQCLPFGTLVHWLYPGTWKKATVGHGGATKAEVLAWVGERWPNHPTPLSQDAADAYCVAVAVRALVKAVPS